MIAMRFAWAGPEASAFTSLSTEMWVDSKRSYDGE
jgi:hypothetical protein